MLSFGLLARDGRYKLPPSSLSAHGEHVMDLLEQVAEGFRSLTAPEPLKAQALRYLRQWLGDEPFAAYRPQIAWLIEQRQWPGLLDRFYQILPFGTGGRRGPVGVGPNRMNHWTLT